MAGFLLYLVLVTLGAVVEGNSSFRRDHGSPGGELGDIQCRNASLQVRNIPHPYDCSKYITCDTAANKSTIYTCKEPLYFNVKTQICDLRVRRAGCGGTTTQPTTQATTTDKNDDYNSVCAKATLKNWHLPFPGDCTKFIKCDIIGKKYKVYTCEKPLHFNPAIQTCDWPENVNCGGSGNGNQTDYDRVCAKATPEVWHLPFPGDCTKFIKCDIIGKKYKVYTCEKPLHFNPAIQTCDWPENVNCGGSGNGNQTDYDRVCAKATPEVWHLPFPGDCTKFIKCDIIGKKYKVYTCDDPLHFNPSIQTCDWPWSAGCTNGSTPSTPVTPATPQTPTNPTECSSSTQTTTDKGCQTTPRDKTCEDDKSGGGDGSSSSSSSEECEPKKTTPTSGCSDSGDKTTSPTPPTGNKCPAPFGPNDVCRVATLPNYWHIADPTNKTRFYKCEIQSCRAFLFDCPAGLVFNQAIQVCDWP